VVVVTIVYCLRRVRRVDISINKAAFQIIVTEIGIHKRREALLVRLQWGQPTLLSWGCARRRLAHGLYGELVAISLSFPGPESPTFTAKLKVYKNRRPLRVCFPNVCRLCSARDVSAKVPASLEDHSSRITMATPPGAPSTAAVAAAAAAAAAAKWPEGKGITWTKSKARELLYADLEAGKYNDMKPQPIHQSRPEFKKWSLPKFRSNYYTARDAVNLGKNAASSARAAYLHDKDMVVAARGGRFHWPGSTQQSLLQNDIEQKATEGKTPQQIRSSREEYQVIPTDKFRNFIHQEQRRIQKRIRANDFSDRMSFITTRIGNRIGEVPVEPSADDV
jgi:hypothetical protein